MDADAAPLITELRVHMPQGRGRAPDLVVRVWVFFPSKPGSKARVLTKTGSHAITGKGFGATIQPCLWWVRGP